MTSLICPITESEDFTPLCTQADRTWVRFAASGFVRLLQMPQEAPTLAVAAAELGAGYVAKYQTKGPIKYRRSLARARYMRRRVTGNSLLDVGSNVGIFVDAAHAAGFEAEGVEPDPTLVAYARKRHPDYRFHQSALEEFVPGKRYAAIYCSEVIEHCTDPHLFATLLYDLLEPGGTLFLTTPDINEYMRDGQVVRDLGAPDHKLYFSRENLGPFLEGVGFKTVRHKFAFRRKGIRVLATR